MRTDGDFLRDHGARAFGSRTRRLYEALNQGVAEAYRRFGFDFEPAWYGLLAVLVDRRTIATADAMATLGLTHAATVQIGTALVTRGYAERGRDATDARRRILKITPKGDRLFHALAPLWDAVEIATLQLLSDAAPDMLSYYDRLEGALGEKPFIARIDDAIADAKNLKAEGT